MTANIPVSVKAIINDLPKIKAQTEALNREEKKAIKEHLSQVSFQRRLENEINRELKEQIAQRKRLNTLSRKLDRDLAKGGGGPALGGLGIGSLAAGLGLGIGINELKDFTVEAEKAGRQLESSQNLLKNALGGWNEYNQAIAQATEITRGMTSEQQLAEGIFNFLQTGLADNTEEAAKLSKAQGILVSTFESLGASEEKFTRLLTSGNSALVDNFQLTLAQINARKAQIEATSDLEGQEAKLAAIKELVIEKADELEGSLTANEIAARQFDAAAANLTATIGQQLTGSFTGAKAGMADLFNALDEGIKKFAYANDMLTNFTNTQRILNAQQKVEAERLGETQSLWSQYIDAVDASSGGLISLIEGTYNAIAGNEEFADTFQDVIEAQEKLAPITQKSTEAIEDNSEALEDEAKRLEKVADIRERSIRKLIDIDEQFQEDVQETWQDWREDQEDLFEDYSEKRADILKKAAKDAAKIEKDLQKDLAKIAKDLGKDLAKIDKDEQKKVNQLKEDAAKEQRQEEKRRRVDALADERLFQFDLRQLGAEGNANAIKEALERREIEQQIEREKQEVESQIKDENLQDDIDRVREEAEERRQERRAEAEERREELREEAEEERAVKEEALQQALEDEKQNFLERSQELAEHRQDKLSQLEQDKKDTIAKIGEELTEIKEITKSELQGLVPVFHEYGDEAGAAFEEGLRKGFDINEILADLLGDTFGPINDQKPPPSGGRLNFDEGGIVPGPLGAPRLAVVHGGEEVLTPEQRGGQKSVTIHLNNPVFGNAVSSDEVIGMLQRYTDEILAPALN